MKEKEKIEGTYFDSLFHPETNSPMTLSQYIDKVKSPEFASRITRLRHLVKVGKAQEAETLKKQLPLFVVGGALKGGRRLEHFVHYSQCLCIDIDDSPIPPSEVIRQAQELPYVKAGHISPTGTGVKLFVRVDSSLEQHAQAFEWVRQQIEKDIPGVKVDVSGKDANRGCFVSYDLLAFNKVETEKMHIAGTSSRHSQSRLLHYLTKFEENNSFLNGSRHQFLVKLSAQLNMAGFSMREVITACQERYACSDFSTAEIEKTVQDIYQRYGTAIGEKSLNSLKSLKGVPEKQILQDEDSEAPDIELDESLLPHFEEAIYDRLPPILTDILKKARSRDEKDIMLLSALTLLSSIMSDVTGSLGEEKYFSCLFSAVIGPSGSGKGCLASMHKLIAPWQSYVYEQSRQEVKAYEKKKREYELYLQRMRRPSRKEPKLPLETLEEPEVVKQKNLNVFGYVTLARLMELLQDNSPYVSCMFETEMEALTQTMGQDFGGYGYLLNQVAHHERVGSDTKNGGSCLAARPKLALLVTGTDGMFKQLVPSTENGTFSRLLIYKLLGNAPYRELTSADDTPDAADYFDTLGQRVLDIALHLESSPTWVKFRDAHRKWLDRYFNREYNKVRAFDNEDLASAVFRYRLATFRIAMVLTALRKGEMRLREKSCTVSDEDFQTAFAITTVCLQHAYVVSTTLKRPQKRAHYKFPYTQQKLFADMPESFKWGEFLEEARVRGICKSSFARMVNKCEKLGLIVSLGAGYYQKTTEGKKVTAPEIP